MIWPDLTISLAFAILWKSAFLKGAGAASPLAVLQARSAHPDLSRRLCLSLSEILNHLADAWNDQEGSRAAEGVMPESGRDGAPTQSLPLHPRKVRPGREPPAATTGTGPFCKSGDCLDSRVFASAPPRLQALDHGLQVQAPMVVAVQAREQHACARARHLQGPASSEGC